VILENTELCGPCGRRELASVLLRSVTEVRKGACGTLCYGRSQRHRFPINVSKFWRVDNALVDFWPYFCCACAETGISELPVTILTTPLDSATMTSRKTQKFWRLEIICRLFGYFSLRMRRNCVISICGPKSVVTPFSATSTSHKSTKSVADLGFGKGGCPFHRKGAPEGRSWRGLWKSRHSLIHFPGISGHYKLYDWVCSYDMSGVDFAGDTISIQHMDRKVEVAPNWATVYFRKGHPKQRAGVRTPWTPSLDPPVQILAIWLFIWLLIIF